MAVRPDGSALAEYRPIQMTSSASTMSKRPNIFRLATTETLREPAGRAARVERQTTPSAARIAGMATCKTSRTTERGGAGAASRSGRYRAADAS